MHRSRTVSERLGGRRHVRISIVALLVLVGALALGIPATAVEIGVPVTYPGHVYASPGATPTADKPQSKLWYHDGTWWALMVQAGSPAVAIFELLPSHTWRDTGSVVDDRVNGTGDALWVAAVGKLYVATRSSTANLQVARLSYSSPTRSWTMDSGHPVTVDTGGGSESATIGRDSTGRLWVTYTRASRLWVAHSDTAGENWTAGFQPNVPDVVITSDDISTLVAFGRSIGVLWSDQQSAVMRFAIHDDADPPSVWRVEDALAGDLMVDDHMNLKQVAGDAQGRIFAAVRTSRDDAVPSNPADPLIGVLIRTPQAGGAGAWSFLQVSTVADQLTRPVIALDQSNQDLYLFATQLGGGDVYFKKTSLAAPSFGSGTGRGAIFMDHTAIVSNPTASKDPVTSQTGLVVLAAAQGEQRYVHAEMILAGGTVPLDTTPPSTPTGLTAAPSQGRIDLAWTASTDDVGVTGYIVRRDGTVVTPTPVAATTYSDTTVSPATTYSYTVQARDAAGNLSPETAPVQATTPDPPPPGAGITFRAATTAATAGAPTIVLPTPTHSPGDLLLTSIDVRGSATITAPAGWQLIRTDTNGTALRKSTYWRIATATEPASTTWQFSSPSTRSAGSALSYSGVSTTTPIGQHAGQVTANSTSITAPTLTTTSSNATTIGLFAVARTATINPPAGMTERSEITSPSTASFFVTTETADITRPTPGPTGPITAGSSLSAANIGQHIALTPAP